MGYRENDDDDENVDNIVRSNETGNANENENENNDGQYYRGTSCTRRMPLYSRRF